MSWNTIKDRSYTTMNEFLADIDLFILNIKSKKNISKMADIFKDFVNEEIDCLKICSQCYDHKKQPFTMLCEQPHMIIWAEASNCPYWPAKLMKSFMKDDELHVNVRFFGDYTVYNVPASNCFLYSKNRPDENILEDNSELYQLALNVSCSSLKLKSNNRSNCN